MAAAARPEQRATRWLVAFTARPRTSLELPDADQRLGDAAQRREAARAWPMKRDEETRSAGVFAELTSLALQLEMPTPLVNALHRATADELGHARLCAEMSGGDSAATPGHAAALRARLSSIEPERRFLSMLAVEVAIGETISSHLFRSAFRGTREPRARAAFEAIYRDEVQHARLGWDGLRLTLAPSDLGWLSEEIRMQFGLLERAQALPALLRLEKGEPFDPTLGALGVLPPERRVEAFYAAIERKVVPSLEALGLSGARAWERRYRGDTASN